MTILTAIAFLAIALCAVLYPMLSGLLALSIKNRFDKLNVKMKATPLSSMMRHGQFWSEAKSLNAVLKDGKIRHQLRAHRIAGLIVAGAFVFWGIAVLTK